MSFVSKVVFVPKSYYQVVYFDEQSWLSPIPDNFGTEKYTIVYKLILFYDRFFLLFNNFRNYFPVCMPLLI